MDKTQIDALTQQIEALLVDSTFTALEAEIIKQKYILLEKKLDVRRLSREHKMPMKHIKREIEKTERKLFNILKNEV